MIIAIMTIIVNEDMMMMKKQINDSDGTDKNDVK